MTKASPPTRRDFAQALVVLAAATATPVLAEEFAMPDAKSYAAAVETIVRYRFGKQLDNEKVEKLTSAYLARRFSAQQLRRVPLANGDDPIAAFRADLP